MKVNISVGGKFHAFYLAKELEKRGYLEKIFTSYPWFKVKELGISKQKVSCLISKEILGRSLNKIISSYYMNNFFDKQVAKCISHCDIFVGWSGFSLYTQQRIRQTFPARIILERGSTHIETQKDTLREEKARLGIKMNLPSPGLVEKELKEYELADCISVPSTLAKDTFLNKGFPQEKLIQVPLGVDIETFKPIPKNDRIFRIICVGISILKGIHYVLEAIEELNLRDLEVWLIGRVDNRTKQLLKKFSGNFKYLGGIPQKDLYKYYSQSSVSILFSLEDGFGMVLLEAMACGLAVICSDKTGAKDVVREGLDGFIVPTRDVEALKEKILYLYEHPDICQEMGLHARERVRKEFTWEHYGKRIVNAYFNILNKSF